MADCIFCKIIGGEIPSSKVWEDRDFFAFLYINPINPGHTLVIPKRHHDYLFSMEPEDYSKLMEAVKSLAGPLKDATGAKKIGLVVEGFLVPHVHVHMVPLNSGGELSFSRASKASPDELAGVAEKIKSLIPQ